MRLLAPLFLALVTGCAAPQVWQKSGANERDFQMTSARCRMASAGVYDVGGQRAPVGNQQQQLGQAMQDLGARVSFMNDCLTADGWARVPAR